MNVPTIVGVGARLGVAYYVFHVSQPISIVYNLVDVLVTKLAVNILERYNWNANEFHVHLTARAIGCITGIFATKYLIGTIAAPIAIAINVSALVAIAASSLFLSLISRNPDMPECLADCV